MGLRFSGLNIRKMGETGHIVACARAPFANKIEDAVDYIKDRYVQKLLPGINRVNKFPKTLFTASRSNQAYSAGFHCLEKGDFPDPEWYTATSDNYAIRPLIIPAGTKITIGIQRGRKCYVTPALKRSWFS